MHLVRTAIGLGILGVIVGAGARRADALSCKVAEWYGTPNGVGIPAKGVLYRYSGLEGGEATMERYDAVDASEVVRLFDFNDWDEARFPIDPAWAAPAEAPRVLAIQRHRNREMYVDGLAIQLDQPVAAVRVFWATPEGTQTRTVAPMPRRTPTGAPAAILGLGDMGCAGSNLPVEDLERGVVLGLTAIRNDGTEVVIRGVPTMVALDDFPTTHDPAPLGYGVVVEREVAETPAPWRPRTNGAMPIALVLGAIVLGVRRGLASAAAGTVPLPRATSRRGRAG